MGITAAHEKPGDRLQSFGQGLFHHSEYPNLPILETLATKTGKGNFWRLADHGINGAYCLDSAWHHGWETAAAVIATIGAKAR